MSKYNSVINKVRDLKNKYGQEWKDINPTYAARMSFQNQFKTGLDIAKYTAGIMRADMAAYDADPSQYTQSLGCWHGFVAQQTARSIHAREDGCTCSDRGDIWFPQASRCHRTQ